MDPSNPLLKTVQPAPGRLDRQLQEPSGLWLAPLAAYVGASPCGSRCAGARSGLLSSPARCPGRHHPDRGIQPVSIPSPLLDPSGIEPHGLGRIEQPAYVVHHADRRDRVPAAHPCVYGLGVPGIARANHAGARARDSASTIEGLAMWYFTWILGLGLPSRSA